MNSQHGDDGVGIFEIVAKPDPTHERIDGKVHPQVQLMKLELLLVKRW